MAQPKGKTGNPNRRPKGSPNKVTTDLREWIKEVLDSNREQFVRDLQDIEPHQRFALLENCFRMQYRRYRALGGEEDVPEFKFFVQGELEHADFTEVKDVKADFNGRDE